MPALSSARATIKSKLATKADYKSQLTHTHTQRDASVDVIETSVLRQLNKPIVDKLIKHNRLRGGMSRCGCATCELVEICPLCENDLMQ